MATVNHDVDLLFNQIISKSGYITLTVFFLGIIIKVVRWLYLSEWGRSLTGFHQFHVSRICSLPKNFFIDFLIFRRILKTSTITWLMVVFFHSSVLLIFLGHLRIFGVWSFLNLNNYLDLSSSTFITRDLPAFLGLLLMFSLLGFIIRRICLSEVRALSTWRDYLVLMILFAKTLVGNFMRISSYIYTVNTSFDIALLPGLIELHLESIPGLTLLYLHIFLAEIFIMFIPFSNLLHIVFSPIAYFLYSLKYSSYCSVSRYGKTK